MTKSSPNIITSLARVLGISPEELKRGHNILPTEGVEGGEVEAEAIMSKYGVRSIEELDRKIRGN